MNSIKSPTLKFTNLTYSKRLLKFKFNDCFDVNELDAISSLINNTRIIPKSLDFTSSRRNKSDFLTSFSL